MPRITQVIHAILASFLFCALSGFGACSRRAPDPIVCGDNVCNGYETHETCPKDCEIRGCGDGICVSGENPTSCPEDCKPPKFLRSVVPPKAAPPQPRCGDGACDSETENMLNCPADCKQPVCANAVCEGHGETWETCSYDCKPPFECGNGVCESLYEDVESCHEDCTCGDGTCGVSETYALCPQDCTVKTCGNGRCDKDRGEDFRTCPFDCDDPDAEPITR